MSGRCTLAAVASLVLLVSAPRAEGLGVPATALSTSLQVDPVFLRYSSLAFQFPETACEFPAQALAFVNAEGYSTDNVYGLGVIARPKGNAVFALGQPALWNAGYYSNFSTTLAQAGWAGRTGAWRFGAAVRFGQGRDDGDNEYRDVSYDGDTRTNGSGVRGRLTRAEAALGLGLRSRGVDLDLAFTLRRVDGTLSSAEFDVAPSVQDTTAFTIESNGDYSPALAARTRFEIGRGTSFVLAGSWSEHRARWRGWEYVVSHEYADLSWEITRLGIDEFGRSWAVGGALTTALWHLDEVMVSASYGEEAQPFTGFNGFGEAPARLFSKNRTGSAAFSVRHGVAKHLDALAGLRVTYEDARGKRREFNLDYSRSDSSRNERVSQAFSWGFTYSWKRARLCGALDMPPQLSTPFTFFDVSVLL